MTSEIEKYLVRNWDVLGLKRNRPSRFSFLGERGSLEGNKFIFFAFADNDKRPILVVKLPRCPSDLKLLENERDSLLQLRASTSMAIRESLPQVLLLDQVSSQWVLIQSFVYGEVMTPVLDHNGLPKRRNLRKHLEITTPWLSQFKNETSSRIIWDSDSIDEHVTRPIDEFRRNSHLSKDAVGYLNSLRHVTDELRGCSVLLFFQHGDFQPGNVLLDKNRITVVDWDVSRKMALALFDEFSFITNYCCSSAERAGRMNYLQAFQILWFSKNWLSRFCKDWLQCYCRTLNLDTKYVKFYFAMFLISHANQEYADLLTELNRGDYMPLRENSAGKRTHYRRLMKEQLYVRLFELLAEGRNLPIESLELAEDKQQQ